MIKRSFDCTSGFNKIQVVIDTTNEKLAREVSDYCYLFIDAIVENEINRNLTDKQLFDRFGNAINEILKDMFDMQFKIYLSSYYLTEIMGNVYGIALTPMNPVLANNYKKAEEPLHISILED